jgi:acetyl esterase/lipase
MVNKLIFFVADVFQRTVSACLFSVILCSVVLAEVRITNIPYVKDGGARQQLDIYLPDNYKTIKPLPVIIAIHGGGWMEGKKEDAAGWVRQFVPVDIAIVGVNYRLIPDFKMPAQIIDCKSAVRWLRAHAKEYNFDTEYFGAWGYSAGGHLSALLGTNEPTKEFDVGENLDQSSAIQAVAAFAAPTDFETLAKDSTWIAMSYSGTFEGNFREKIMSMRKMSPALLVNKSTAPMLLVHAEDDELVSFSQSQELYDALQKNQIESRLIKLISGNGGHSSKSFNSNEIQEIMKQFFEKYLTVPAEPQKTETNTNPSQSPVRMK